MDVPPAEPSRGVLAQSAVPAALSETNEDETSAAPEASPSEANAGVTGHVGVDEPFREVPAPVSETKEVEAPLAQCKYSSYLFCCDFGAPCDFGVPTASGQCSEMSYAFCCGVGTPCDCRQPPLHASTENIGELTEVSVFAEMVEARTTVEESPAPVQV